jgi:hypothetical protein
METANVVVGRVQSGGERRSAERRRRLWWSILYGNFNPRRRWPQRRIDDARHHSVDWHAAPLFAVSIGILLLSAADAFMTVVLLAGGAEEINPLMAAVIYKSSALFALLKMGMTGIGVLTMVYLARYRFMRILRVEVAMYVIFLIYLALLAYEFWMLRVLMIIPEL